MTVIRLGEYQPPTRLDQLAALGLLMEDAAPDWAINHFAARIDAMAAEVVTASTGVSGQVVAFPEREPTAADFECALQAFAKAFCEATRHRKIESREATPKTERNPTTTEVFHNLVEIRKREAAHDNIAAVRVRALKQAKRKPSSKAPDMQEFRAIVKDTALPPDLQRLEAATKAASAERPWVKERAQKRAGKSTNRPDDGSVERVCTRIREAPRKPREKRV